jgi:trehalose/maltose hydrolase-like predicted phosphorylase
VRHLCIKWSFYQDRLGTNIGKTPKRTRFCRQYWYATGDKDWLTSIGFPLAKGVAEFYAKRAVPRSYKVTTRTASDDAYDINDVMGPDEYAFPVNNSAYTNAAAIIALSFATEAAGVLGEHPR